ncbi:MAG: adenylate/guanylate cyclase domain-containing protein [Lachnospiraceae bacterium]|nr:adenylate/guanylate cyclase domain-containing protein [Lachnospiraceae bacterium]
MSRINVDEIYLKTKEHYNKAKKTLQEIKHSLLLEHADAISDTIPGYQAEYLEFGSYAKDNFAVLFVDMRHSTKRAQTIGPEKTFLTMHAYIPALLEVIKFYNGKVVDIMGDGIMVFFGGKKSNMTKEIAVKKAGLCGKDMLRIIDKVVNKILQEEKIQWDIDIGVGVDYGNVIVTKIGIQEFYDVKAFGDCVNKASKYSNGHNQVKVSKQVKKIWPSSEHGKIKFIPSNDKDCYILS